MISALAIATVFTTLISPLLAVRAQKFIEKRSEQKTLKINIFTQLMATRSPNTRLSNEHVRALNMIDLAFYGKIKKGQPKRTKTEKNVLSAWKLYLSHLNIPFPDNESAGYVWNNNSNELFLDLLSSIAEDLGYDFDRSQLQNAIYSPIAHGDLENDQIKIRKGLASVLSGEIPLKMEVTKTPKDQEG